MKEKIKKLLCFLGLHRWQYGGRTRRCVWCAAMQEGALGEWWNA